MSETKSEQAADLGALMRALEEDMKHIKTLEESDFPITVKKVKLLGTTSVRFTAPDEPKVGTFVSVRLAGDKKTLLGIYLGDMIVYSGQTMCSLDSRTGVLMVSGFMGNPAIFVPDLNRVVWGMESWWGEIESPEHLREITDEDIQNVWYVKALQQLSKKGEETE